MNPSNPPAEYRQWADEAPHEHKKELIRRFTQKTLSYAHEHIAMREKELHEIESCSGSPEEIARKKKRLLLWRGYVEFQEHTLTELEGEKLDSFID